MMQSTITAWIAAGVLFWALSARCAAQIAVTDDGRTVYFVSSLRQKNTNQFAHPKLFRISDTGEIQLIEQVERRPPQGFPTNFYAVETPTVSADGSVLAYSLHADCTSPSGCVFTPRDNGVVRSTSLSEPLRFDGRAQISANGRYVVSSQWVTPFPYTNRVDLQSSEQIRLEGRILAPAGRHSVTNDGRVLGLRDGELVFWDKSGTRTLQRGPRILSAEVSRNGDVVVYRTQANQLFALRPATGAITYVGEGSSPVLSADGEWVLYVAPRFEGAADQAWLNRTRGGQPRRITDLNERWIAIDMTGGADVAFVQTASQRLLRLDLHSGAERELLPGTAVIESRTGAPVPGSLNWLHGFGLAGIASVRLGALEAPILYRDDQTLVFQIPFEAPIAEVPLQALPDESPLESAVTIPLVARRPELEVRDAIHSDFRGFVTIDDLARPNEVVHFYMTGLGPTEPFVPTGQPAPLDRVALLRDPLQCEWIGESGNRQTLSVLFAGLAPGMTGIYQVSIRLPASPKPFDTDPTRSYVLISCVDALLGIPVRLPAQ
jgi:uncharacterized protein (TIGR03437 family)